jgi:hypothetical protein
VICSALVLIILGILVPAVWHPTMLVIIADAYTG